MSKALCPPGPREIELKLEIDPAASEAAIRRLLRSVAAAEAGETRRLVSRYFDTPESDLRRQGRVLRIRDQGSERIQTLKSDPALGGLDRGEWECALAGDTPDPDAFAPPLAEDLAGYGPLRPVVETQIERTTWNLDEAGTRIELAFDRGRIAAAGREAAIREIELELKAGGVGDLFRLASRLAGAGPVRLAVQSKSERGFGMLAGEPQRVFKAGKVVLSHHMDAGEAFRTIGWSCLRHLRLNEPLLAAERHPEALHQARVAIRRLRSAFTLFKPVIAGAEAERLKAELRGVSRVLGEARNLDVYRSRVLAREGAAQPEEPGLAELDARIARARERAYDTVLRRLGSRRFRLLTLDLAGFLEAGAWQEDAVQEARDEKAAVFAGGVLDKRRRRVARDGRHLDRMNPAERHRVRIEAKKLRYACEFFATLFPGAKAKRRHERFVAALEDLQTCLGELNDIETGHQMALRMARRAGAGPTPGRLLFAAGHVSGGQDAREGECLAGALAAQRRVRKAKRFWR